MGAPRKADWREERRKRAWSLKEQDWQQKDIAVALGVSEGAVSQWLKRGRAEGVEALNAHPPEGMFPRLTAEQKAQIPGLLAKGAQAYGFRGDAWTASRVAKVIDQTFGIRYHRDHVGWSSPAFLFRCTAHSIVSSLEERDLSHFDTRPNFTRSVVISHYWTISFPHIPSSA